MITCPSVGLRICTRWESMTVMKENCGMMLEVMPLGRLSQKTAILLTLGKMIFTNLLDCSSINTMKGIHETLTSLDKAL